MGRQLRPTPAFNPHVSVPGTRSLRVGGLTCWVDSEQQHRFVCAPKVSQDGKVFTCWIESKANQEFSVHWHNNLRNVALEGQLYIDGVLCDTHIIPDAHLAPHPVYATVHIGWAQTSGDTRQNFVFSKVVASNDDGRIRSDNLPDEFGTIRLEVRRARLERWKRVQHDPMYSGPILEDTAAPVLDEGIAHRTTFGEEYHHPQRKIEEVRGFRIDEEKPWYTFIFKYRPLEELLRMNAVPDQFLRAPATLDFHPGAPQTSPQQTVNAPSRRASTPAIKMEHTRSPSLYPVRVKEENIDPPLLSA